MGTERPRTAAGYRPEWLEWARSLCLELATILGGFLEEDVTIVGGLVPPLLIPEEELEAGTEVHPGTMDVDAALSLALLDESRYSALAARLRQAGFRPGTTEEGNVTRQRWVVQPEGDHEMKLEFLIGPPTDDAEPGRLQDLEGDFAAWIMPGMQLSFDDRERVSLKGRTLRGEEVERAHIWVAGPGAFVVLKALDILRSRFETVDSPGPVRAAAFLGREDDDDLRADVRGFVMDLVEECDQR